MWHYLQGISMLISEFWSRAHERFKPKFQERTVHPVSSESKSLAITSITLVPRIRQEKPNARSNHPEEATLRSAPKKCPGKNSNLDINSDWRKNCKNLKNKL